jgi:hypothetical protein
MLHHHRKVDLSTGSAFLNCSVPEQQLMGQSLRAHDPFHSGFIRSDPIRIASRPFIL